MISSASLKRALLVANIVTLLALAGLGADWWVRHRAEQTVLMYHQATIVPLIRPAVPSGPPPGSSVR